MKNKYIIFTDLDGTLLDHHTYSYQPAITTINKIRQAQIPLVLTTSKTAAEVQVLHQELALDSPYITENGAAISVPKGALPYKPSGTSWRDDCWQMQFARSRRFWVDLLKQIEPQFAGLFTYFSAMSTEQIVQATGLDYYSATRAAQREFTEPVLWLGSEQKKTAFIDTLREKGASVVTGGRFLHISGGCNKGRALQWLSKEYSRQYPEFNWLSIALGDSENDVDMLEEANHPICIRSPVKAFPTINSSVPCIYSQSIGPRGWAETLDAFLFNQT